MAKSVSRSSYIWAHVATIIFHVILAILILVSTSQSKAAVSYTNYRVLMTCGVLLLVVSLLAIIPIASHSQAGITIG